MSTESQPTTTVAASAAPAGEDSIGRQSLRRITGRSALVSAGVEIAGRALTLLLSLAVARTLGPKETGLLGLAVLIAGFVSFLAAHPETAAVAVPRDGADSAWALAAVLLRSAALFLIGAALIATLLLVCPHSRFAGAATAPRLIRITAVLLLIPLFECLNTYAQVVLQRKLELAPVIRAQGLQYVVSSAAGLTALYLGWGIEGVAAAAVFAAACSSLLLWAQSMGRLGPARRCDRAQVRQLTTGTGRVALGSVGGYVAQRIDNFLVAASLGVTGMGLYAMAWNTSRLPLVVLSRPASVALLPALASIQHDTARVTRGIRESLTLTLTAMAGCSGVLVVSAPGLVGLVLGPSWMPIVPCLRLMAFTALVSAMVPVGSALLTATGRAHLQVWPALLGIVCFLLLMPPTAARFGLIGAAFVDFFAAAMVTAAMYVLARRALTEVKWWSGQQAMPVLAAAAGALLAWPAGRAFDSSIWRLSAELCVFAVGYAGLLRLFGGRAAFASLLDLAREVIVRGARDRTSRPHDEVVRKMVSDTQDPAPEATAPRTRRLEACPLCGSTISRRAFTLPDRLHGVPGEFSYERCGDCAAVYQNPQVIAEDLPRCYPDGYYTHVVSAQVAPDHRAFSGTRSRLRDAITRARRGETQPPLDAALGRVLGASRSMRERAFYGLLDELIPRRAEHGRALEIGCGSGQLLALLRLNGWNAEGVEWDATAAAAARARTGLPVRVGNYAQLDLPQQEYDLVVLQHVFERLPDPGNALKILRRLVRATGRIVLASPNPRGLGARLFGRDWLHWDSPRHLVLAPSRAVARAGARAHLSLVSCRTVTRCVDAGFPGSRAFRQGRRAQDMRPSISDVLASRVSGALAGLGLGEEMVVVFAPAGGSTPEG